MNPARIGRYEILRPLGKGAMGLVYLARDPQIERTLALKTVRFDGPSQSFSVSEAKARFLKEAKISGRLQHPNIVTVFDVGEDEGVLYLAMEYISGGALSQRLTDGIEFPIPERIRILSEVADALAHAHQRGVIHRDVKPANILLTEASVAKVTDFGIGKLLTGDTDLTSTGQMVGSPAYMSPEQIRGDKLDVRSDIFSLGVVLYQTLTLKKPFPADTLTTLVYQILHNQPDDPLVHNDELPPEITQIALKCLEKDRENRYGDAVELADDLRAIIGIAPLVSTSGLTESKVGRARKLAAAAASVATPTMQMPAGASPRAAAPPPQTPQPGSAPTEVSASRVMTRTGGRTSTTSSQPSPAAIAGAAAGGLLLAGIVVGGFFFLRAQGLFGRSGATPAVAPEPTATATPEAGATGTTVDPAPEATPDTTPATTPTAPEPTPAGTPAAATARPSAGRTAAPTSTPRPRPSPTATPIPTASPVPTPTPAPLSRPDATYITRRSVKLNASPSQARVFLDGRYIGISDDWDDGGGGSLLSFASEGKHRLRFAYAGRKDLIVDIVVAANAAEDRVEVDRGLEKGTPDGPTGPGGKIGRPDYQTAGLVRLEVEPLFASVTVDGHDMGPVTRFVEQDMQVREQGVYDVVLMAPGHQPRTVRLLVSPSTGKERIVIREKLKKW
ncbi:MAG: protein kinase [Holophagales bacterium]|nr:protein kinase [Holophagales bacterium]